MLDSCIKLYLYQISSYWNMKSSEWIYWIHFKEVGRPLSHRNQSINLQSKSMDWFLYDNGLRHEKCKIMCLLCYSADSKWYINWLREKYFEKCQVKILFKWWKLDIKWIGNEKIGGDLKMLTYLIPVLLQSIWFYK